MGGAEEAVVEGGKIWGGGDEAVRMVVIDMVGDGLIRTKARK